MDTPKKNKVKEEAVDNNDLANRARNRTVMLPRDVTGQVRTRLQTNANNDPERESYRSMDIQPPGSFNKEQTQQGQKTHKNPGVKNTPIIGFLVSYDQDPNGEVYELRSGRVIVSSEAAGAGEHLLIDHPTVSPMHAIIRINPSGEIQVLDQLSEHGTKIIRVKGEIKELSGEKGPVYDGDTISFGERNFHICLVKRK